MLSFVGRNTYNIRSFQIISNDSRKSRNIMGYKQYRTTLHRPNLPNEYKLESSLGEFKQ